MSSYALYRHFNADGVLLYVGMTGLLDRRIMRHARRSAWGRELATITVQWFDTREAGLKAEAAAIRSERPLYNAQEQDLSSWSRARKADKPPVAPQNERLVAEIEAFCQRHKLSHTAFGRQSIGDPALFNTLWDGRDLGRRIEGKMRVFMADMDRRIALTPNGIGSADE